MGSGNKPVLKLILEMGSCLWPYTYMINMALGTSNIPAADIADCHREMRADTLRRWSSGLENRFWLPMAKNNVKKIIMSHVVPHDFQSCVHRRDFMWISLKHISGQQWVTFEVTTTTTHACKGCRSSVSLWTVQRRDNWKIWQMSKSGKGKIEQQPLTPHPPST